MSGKVAVAAAIMFQVGLLARAICWEAPGWAAQDRPYVAAVIRTRMLQGGLAVEEILFSPGQFSVAHLLERDPPGIEQCLPLAAGAYDWTWEDLPIIADHFWSPVYLSEPPAWASPECEVEAPGTIHRFYYLGGTCGN